ncbi:MAG: hypothetical protein ACYTFA_13060 [Planctomycetota bacterium]|jgi:hypothetical protein
MTAGLGIRKGPFVIALAVGLLASSVSASGPEIRLQPVTASGNVFSLPDATDPDDSEIILSAGGVTVTMFVELSAWDSIDGGHPGDSDWFLGGPQGTIDSATYLGGAPGSPGTLIGYDLVPLGWIEGRPSDGAFMALKVCGNLTCVSEPFEPGCVWDPLSVEADCSPPATYPIDRPDYIFYGTEFTCGVSFYSLDHAFYAASPECKEDPRCDPPNSCRFYLGTLILEVPAGAKGTYNVNFIDDPNFTMFNSCTGPPIPGLIRKAGTITIQTGKCCYGFGTMSAGCADGMTQAECDGTPAPRLPIDPDSTCNDGCCDCLDDGDCENDHPDGMGEDDKCTNDWCDVTCICRHDPNYQVGIDCCDPDTGLTEPIDDDFVCTDDICDPATGIVDHPALKGLACTVDDAVHDGAPEQADCYTDFECINPGVCMGIDLNTIPCPTGPETDCPEGIVECEGGYCLCEVCSTLVLDVESGARGVIAPNCFSLGQAVNVNVAVVGGSKTLTGGQFLIGWDPACLDYVGTSPGSPWSENPIKIVDEEAGTIFYVALTDPAVSAGAPAGVFVTLHFLKLGGCDECDLCFHSINPQNTILSDDKGNAVIVCNPDDCSKAVRLRGDLVVGGPGGLDINADCGEAYADRFWNAPTATDSCDGDLPIICNGAYAHNIGDPGVPSQGTIDALILNGGRFTQGEWWFECHAQNSCGSTDRYVWSVIVSDQNALDVEVHLGNPFVASAVSRCICFELWAGCLKDPDVACSVVDFGPPYNFKGHGIDTLKIDKNNYMCVSAFDPLHTLRATTIPECVDNAWKAVWKGDPWLGGNWLIGGNLDYIKPDGGNGPDTIDVRDFAKFIYDLGSVYADGNTDCATAEPHADINGDGMVDNIDFSIIQMNFLKASKITCCDKPEAASTPLTEISVKDMRQMGLGDLIIADLNGDGLLNMDDMAAYQNGVVPTNNG